MGVSIQVPREFQLYVGRTSIISKRRKVAGAPAPELTWEGVGGAFRLAARRKRQVRTAWQWGLSAKPAV